MRHILFLIALLAIASCNQSNKKENSEKTSFPTEAKEGLPAIKIVTTKGDSVSFKTTKGRTILILFTPDCDHCQREAADISAHLELFEKYRLYFVAAQTPDVMNEFATKYNLSDKPNVIFAQSGIEKVVTLLKPTSMPTILIYNEDGWLVARFDGETDVEAIAKFL